MNKKRIWAIVTYLIFLCIAFAPAVFGDDSLYPMTYTGRSAEYLLSDEELLENIDAGGIFTDSGASDWVEIPMVMAAAENIRNEELPLWNPYNSLGMPVIDNNNGSTLAPFTMLLYLNDSEMMWNLMYLLRILLAMFGTFLFLEELGLCYGLALAGGIIFGFSGYVMFYFNIFFFHVDAFLPMLMWVTVCLSKKFSFRRWTACTLVVAAMCLGGNPQNLITCCILAVCYFVFCNIFVGKDKIKNILLYLCCYVFAVLLTMGYWLSFLTLYQSSYSYHANAGMQAKMLKELLGFVIPVGRFAARYREWMPYVGGSVALTVLIQLTWKRAMPYWKEKVFFAAFAFLFILKIIGAPFIHELGRLPILNELGFVKYNSPVYFAVAVLAVFALNDMFKSQNRVRIRLQCVVIAVIAVLFCFIYQTGILSQMERANRYLLAASIGLILITVLLFSGFFFQKLRISQIGIVLLICVELVSYPVSQWDILVPKGAAFQEPDFVQQLKVQQEHTYDRVFCVGNILIGNLSALYGIPSAGGISPLPEIHYWNFMKEFVLNHKIDLQMVTAQSSVYTPESKKYLDMLGVKFLIIDDFGEIIDASLEPVYDSGRLKIYRNLSAFGKAFTVHQVLCSEDEKETFSVFETGDIDFTREAVVESTQDIAVQPLSGMEADEVEITEYCANSVNIRCNMQEDGILVLSDLYYPGWNAYVNGRQREVLRTNDILRGVFLEAGVQEVVFRYEPSGWKTGVLISIVSVIVFGIGAIVYGRKKKGI